MTESRKMRRQSAQVKLCSKLEQQLGTEKLQRMLRDRWELEREGSVVVEVTPHGDGHALVVENAKMPGVRIGFLVPAGYPDSAPRVLYCGDRSGLSWLCRCIAPALSEWKPTRSIATIFQQVLVWSDMPLTERDAACAACRCYRDGLRARSSLSATSGASEGHV